MRVTLFLSILISLLLTSCNYKKKLTAISISLSPVYSSGMVLQTTPSTIIAGTANPGGVLAVKIRDYLILAEADENGNWQVNFPEIRISEAFSISFEGRDTSFTFNNILAGKIYIIAGDGNLPILFGLQNRRNFSSPAQTLRVFRPLINGGNRLQKDFSSGKWHPFSEAMNYKKTSQLLPKIMQIIPETDIPIGIIDLTWPGSEIESWLPGKGDFHLNNMTLDPSIIDSCILLNEYVLNQIMAMKDTCQEGIKNGVTRIWYNDESWRTTDLPVSLGKKENTQEKRIVYMRKKIYVPEKYIGSNFYINIGYHHGIARYFFNETEVYPLLNLQHKNQLLIPDSLMRVWTNILTIRLFCADSLAGFYGEEFSCHNVDSSYYRTINDDWKYSFNLESEFPKLIPLEQVHGFAYHNLLLPSLNSSTESIFFQFSLLKINQTEEFSRKACELLDALPKPYNMSLTRQSLSLADTLIYRIEPENIDSIFLEVEKTCGIEAVNME